MKKKKIKNMYKKGSEDFSILKNVKVNIIDKTAEIISISKLSLRLNLI